MINEKKISKKFKAVKTKILDKNNSCIFNGTLIFRCKAQNTKKEI